MKQIIQKSNILACGVWHKGKNTRSSLDEAVAALGKECIIINGGFFNSSGTPSSAYSVAKTDYHTGGCQFGFGLSNPHTIRWSYLRGTSNDFIGAYPMYLSNGKIEGNDDGQRTSRMILGLIADNPYIETSTGLSISAALQKAKDAGCTYAINLDGGGSVQYYLPDGTNYYGTDPRRKVLNWVWFKIGTTQKEDNPMGVKIYYKSGEGNNSLSPHFKVKEFACKDGENQILIDANLVNVLEEIRSSCGNKPITINSGYRTQEYNEKIGGAPNSYHVKGQAADIKIVGVTPRSIAESAETALAKQGIAGGICLYSTFTHVDTRATRYRAENFGTEKAVLGFTSSMPTIKKGSTGEAVKTIQKTLGGLTVDGVFGNKTDDKVKAFQKSNGLIADGIVGVKTWGKIVG